MSQTLTTWGPLWISVSFTTTVTTYVCHILLQVFLEAHNIVYVIHILPGFWGVLREVLYADDVILVNETMERLINKFRKGWEAFESNYLNDNLRESKVLIS